MQILVVRNDLKMGKGKIAAQCRYVIFVSVTLLMFG
jgi:peptidyl-tRNA hydrolase